MRDGHAVIASGSRNKKGTSKPMSTTTYPHTSPIAVLEGHHRTSWKLPLRSRPGMPNAWQHFAKQASRWDLLGFNCYVQRKDASLEPCRSLDATIPSKHQNLRGIRSVEYHSWKIYTMTSCYKHELPDHLSHLGLPSPCKILLRLTCGRRGCGRHAGIAEQLYPAPSTNVN